MQELIKVTTNGQGSQVVSARALYDYLGMKSANWKRWYEKNIEENPFALEKVDWEGFIIEKNGNETKDFALSLDFAKKLAMMSRTERGEQARNYFIECEKQLKAPKILTPAELQLQQAQLLVDIERKQSEFDSRLKAIEESRNVATQELLIAERSTETIPEETLRTKIRRLINQYCEARNADQQSVWRVVYDRLYYRYGVSLRAIVKRKNESTLDVAERLGHLDKIWAICSNELV